MKNDLMIEWGEVVDNHLMGITPLGKVFIRFNRQNKITGMYTMFGEVEKFVPQEEFEEDINFVKKKMSDIVQNKLEREIFLKKDLKL